MPKSWNARHNRAGCLPYLLAADIADIDITALSKKERKARNIQDTALTP